MRTRQDRTWAFDHDSSTAASSRLAFATQVRRSTRTLAGAGRTQEEVVLESTWGSRTYRDRSRHACVSQVMLVLYYLHTLPHRSPSGSSCGVRSDVEYVPPLSDSGVRGPEGRWRSGTPQSVRATVALGLPQEDPPPSLGVRYAATEALVHRGNLRGSSSTERNRDGAREGLAEAFPRAEDRTRSLTPAIAERPAPRPGRRPVADTWEARSKHGGE